MSMQMTYIICTNIYTYSCWLCRWIKSSAQVQICYNDLPRHTHVTLHVYACNHVIIRLAKKVNFNIILKETIIEYELGSEVLQIVINTTILLLQNYKVIDKFQ